VEADDLASVRALLDAGADPQARARGNETALFKVRSAAVARVLVDVGLSVRDVNWLRWDPLRAAVSDGSILAVDALLAVGADCNATYDRGFTIFMTAAGFMERSTKMMSRIVRAGANVHAVSELSYNAFHAAIDVNGEEANSLLNVRRTMVYLKHLGIALEQVNHRGLTPLGRAIHEGTAVEVRVLCEVGANVDATAPYPRGGRPERVALVFHAIDAYDAAGKLEPMLRAGARLDVRDPWGRTPLESVAGRREGVLGWEEGSIREHTLAGLAQCEDLLRAAMALKK
jgi:ankyrin repeat protein